MTATGLRLKGQQPRMTAGEHVRAVIVLCTLAFCAYCFVSAHRANARTDAINAESQRVLDQMQELNDAQDACDASRHGDSQACRNYNRILDARLAAHQQRASN